MVLVKMKYPEQENIVARNTFVANNIFLIGIKQIPDSKSFLFLFMAYQDYDDSYIYIQAPIYSQNAFDFEYLDEHELNIKNLANNTSKDTKITSYKELIRMMNNENIYSCDMEINQDETHPSYYHMEGVRVIDKDHASVLDIYLPLHNFVRLQVYFARIFSVPNHRFQHESIFAEKLLKEVKLYDIVEVTLNGTKILSENGTILKNFMSHYTVRSGTTYFRFNTISISYENNALINPMDCKAFDAIYSEDSIVTLDYFNYDDHGYILTRKKGKVFDPDPKIEKGYNNYTAEFVILRLNSEIREKISLFNPDSIFIK